MKKNTAPLVLRSSDDPHSEKKLVSILLQNRLIHLDDNSFRICTLCIQLDHPIKKKSVKSINNLDFKLTIGDVEIKNQSMSLIGINMCQKVEFEDREFLIFQIHEHVTKEQEIDNHDEDEDTHYEDIHHLDPHLPEVFSFPTHDLKTLVSFAICEMPEDKIQKNQADLFLQAFSQPVLTSV